MADERSDADRREAFETALGSEYFALNGLRAGTTAEANARATLFFTTLTGTLLALGFLYGNTTAAAPVSYAALPTVGILGLLSFLRLVELAALDVRALQAMNRIRDYWRDLAPDGTEFFPRTAVGQAVDTVLDTGERRGLLRSTLTIAATVGLVDSLWIGAGVGFGVADAGSGTPLAVIIGSAIGLTIYGWMFRHQALRIGHVVGDAPTSR
ncbi:MAG: hypothetical protein ABI862_20965 [Ilumatobacteraceae bacterium]